MRRRRDRDLLGRQVVTRPHERQRLERLRRGAEKGDALGIARLLDDRAVAHGDRVHDVRRLDDAAAADDHLDRAHGRQAYATSCDHSSQNTFEQHRLPRLIIRNEGGEDVGQTICSASAARVSRRRPHRGRALRTGSHCGDQAGVPQAPQQPVREAARVRHARGRACSPGRVPGDRERERRQPRRRDLRVRRERRLRGQEARRPPAGTSSIDLFDFTVAQPVQQHTPTVATHPTGGVTGSALGTVNNQVTPIDIKLAPADRASSTSGCDGAYTEAAVGAPLTAHPDGPSDFAGFVAGRIALVQRGGCSFALKVANAQTAGAAAVILFNQGEYHRPADRPQQSPSRTSRRCRRQARPSRRSPSRWSA